jgi:C4-type Zn-finger protein
LANIANNRNKKTPASAGIFLSTNWCTECDIFCRIDVQNHQEAGHPSTFVVSVSNHEHLAQHQVTDSAKASRQIKINANITKHNPLHGERHKAPTRHVYGTRN